MLNVYRPFFKNSWFKGNEERINYLKAVGYSSTVAVLRTFDPIPLAMRIVSRPIWRNGMSVVMIAIPQAPVPAKIEKMIGNFGTISIIKVIMMAPPVNSA